MASINKKIHGFLNKIHVTKRDNSNFNLSVEVKSFLKLSIFVTRKNLVPAAYTDLCYVFRLHVRHEWNFSSNSVHGSVLKEFAVGKNVADCPSAYAYITLALLQKQKTNNKQNIWYHNIFIYIYIFERKYIFTKKRLSNKQWLNNEDHTKATVSTWKKALVK